jgi:hypothetical protein
LTPTNSPTTTIEEKLMSTKKRIAAAAITALVAVLGAVVMASPAQAAENRIKQWSSGKCLDAAAERDRATVVQIWDCKGNIQQQWIQTLFPRSGQACCFEYRSVFRNYCMRPTVDILVNLGPCLRDIFGQPHDRDLWRVWYAFNPGASVGGWYAQLQNVEHGGCLQHVPFDDTSNGVQLALGPCDPTHPNHQRWKLLF